MGFASFLCCAEETSSVDSHTASQSQTYRNKRGPGNITPRTSNHITPTATAKTTTNRSGRLQPHQSKRDTLASSQLKKKNRNSTEVSVPVPRASSENNSTPDSKSSEIFDKEDSPKKESQDKSSTEKEVENTKMTAYYNSESSQGNDHSSSLTDTYEDAASLNKEKLPSQNALLPTGTDTIAEQANESYSTSTGNNNIRVSSTGEGAQYHSDSDVEKESVDEKDEEGDYDMLHGQADNLAKPDDKIIPNAPSTESATATPDLTNSQDIIYQAQQTAGQIQPEQVAQGLTTQQVYQAQSADYANVDPSNTATEQQLYSDANDVQNDIDYNMMSNYEDSEEYVDLTELQPDQYHAPGYTTLLSPVSKTFKNKKCLVLDLDETLVHSSFKYLRSADFVLPVDIDDQIHNVYVIKRPGVDEFLRRVGELYEVVVFTASVSRYGDPLLDKLDINKAIHHRLFREACYNYEGNYIKNLSQIGRPLSDIIILDNSPASYIFHPQHAIPISSWFSDTHDNELLDIIPLLEDLANKNVLDVGKVLDVSI